MFTAVYQIADRKEPVARRVERDVAQQIAQCIHAAMQIAYDKVAAAPIGRMMLDGVEKYGSHSLMIDRQPQERMRVPSLFLVPRIARMM
jgi:hypothetical protein